VKKLQKYTAGIVFILMLVTMVTVTAFAKGGDENWPFAGHNLENSRHAKTESKLSIDNVQGLTPNWVFTAGGDISATPAVEGDFIYFPDWAGNLFKLDKNSGAVIWSTQISSYTGIPEDFARTTPAIVDDLLIFGDQGGRFFAGAYVMAVDKNTGDLVWLTKSDDHPAAIITQSAVAFDGLVYVGVASFEELYAAVIPGYQCCTFRGSLLALDAQTGEIVWKSYTAPEGYSGNAVWGSTPVVDRVRKSVYISTGNNYSVPDTVLQCITANENDPDAQRACVAGDDFFDAVVALNLKTGEVKWSNIVIPFDAWTVSCLEPFDQINPENCPEPEGPDFDFGQGPILYTVKPDNGSKYDLLGIGQKSGQYWALNPDTGETVWSTQVGPGGVAGGMMWGSAYDGERLYMASTNSEFKPWTLVDGTDVFYGFWSALDPATGEILWQSANPAIHQANGAVTVANGIVFACSMDANGYMYAMNAATGDFLWSFASGDGVSSGTCAAGAAIVDGTVYWGSGYASFGGFPNDKLFSFGLP
jgi:polyvinyl alcohol dehydrogenase (cytochrome)